MEHKNYFIFLSFLIFILSACQSTKYLKQDQLLYNSTILETTGNKKEQPNKRLKSALALKVKQQPNNKIAGQRFKLWVYQQYKDHQKEKGLRHWIKTKIGEPPVIYNQVKTEQSRLLMQQSLRQEGFLNATVSVDTTIKNKLINVTYTIDGNGQFFIDHYLTPPDTTKLLTLINEKYKRPIIKSNMPYSKATIDAERLRIENLAKNNGFYEFDQNALYFYIDTVKEDRKLDIYLVVNPPANQKNYAPHLLGNITIYPDYSLNKKIDTTQNIDTIQDGSWRMIQNDKVIKLSAVQEAIVQDSGAVYSQALERQAINYLLDLGIFKFVNLKYEKKIIDGRSVLNRNFYLTPNLNQDVSVELEASTERTNFLGYTVGLNYIHRNIFNGAEQFKTGLSVGVETQAGGNGPFLNTLEVNYDAGFTIPRLLLPFKITKRMKGVIPKTLINLNTAYQQRNTLFTSASVTANFGYSWKQNNKFQHQFYPVQLTYLRLLSTSSEFDDVLSSNPRLRASFDDIILLGANYKFTYSDQQINTRKNFLYFRGELESNGNLSSLISTSTNTEGKKTLLGTSIAQLASIQTEFRYTFYQPKTSIVTRFISGVAIPYGNSDAVPYIRQFFVGGASSIRAFRFRGIGPGSYDPPESNSSDNFAFFDRVGDVKIEANIEYRFPIISYLKGALFLDAGNVWLIKQSAEELPEGRFEFNRFYKELAIGTGFGIRFDAQYVVIRFDFGIPLRDPSRPDGDRWTVNQIDLLNKDWRSENLKFNLAIGYPF